MCWINAKFTNAIHTCKNIRMQCEKPWKHFLFFFVINIFYGNIFLRVFLRVDSIRIRTEICVRTAVVLRSLNGFAQFD